MAEKAGLTAGAFGLLVDWSEFFHFVEKLTQVRTPGTLRYRSNKMAEKAGFEPAVPCDTHDFQSCTFGRLGHLSKSCRTLRRGGDSNPR